MSNEILVFSEKSSLLRELLGKARQEADALGWQVGAVIAQGSSENLGDAGADVVYPVPAVAASGESPELLTEALAEVVRLVQPAFVLVGATHPGMEAAARLVERAGAAYAPWTVRFSISPADCSVTAGCMIYTGSGLATYQFKPGLVILSSAPGAFTKVEGAGKAGRLVELPLSIGASPLAVLGSHPKARGTASLEDARMVLDVGQGFKVREDLALIEALAGLLDGQVACSRPVSSDRDWFPEWLGLSGKKVKPELCLTVGISGAIQHIVGIRDSHLIAAVNNDEGAPIFNNADYGVVADLYEFLPALAERIKARGVKPAWS